MPFGKVHDLENFDLVEFTDEVGSILKELTPITETTTGSLFGPAVVFVGSWITSILTVVAAVVAGDLSRTESKGQKEVQDALKNAEAEAKELVARPDIRALLCPSLKQASSDAFDISKSITPVLAGAVLAGTINIPMSSLLFAVIALVIARIGVEVLCRNQSVAEKSRK